MRVASAGSGRTRRLVATGDGRAAVAEPLSAAARLRAMRSDTRAAFAPLILAATVAGGAVVAATAPGSVPAAALLGWMAALIASACVAAWRVAGSQRRHPGRDGPDGAAFLDGAAMMLAAAVWAALPALSFADAPATWRIAIVAVGCVLSGAGVAIATAPVVATLWAGTIGLPIVAAAAAAGGPRWPAVAAAIALQAALLLFAIHRVGRIAAGFAAQAATRDGEAAAAAQLVREYEERGTSCLWQTGPDHAVRYATPAIAAMFGRGAAATVGLPLAALMGGDEALGAALCSHAAFSGVEIALGEGAAARTILVSGTPVVDAAGKFAGFRGACVDVTDARRSERRLRQLASLDVLTGLPNRMRMRELVGEALLDARTGGRPFALLMLDLDGFKPVNDSFGHPAGDQLLKTVAARLVAATGEAGIVGRLGGDEFAVLVSDAAGRWQAGTLAERLIAAAAEPCELDGGSVRVGLSIGAAWAPVDGETVDRLVKRADLALYEAKAAGRGTWRHFDPTMETLADERLRTERDLRAALALSQFRLLYQPVIRAADRRVVAFEALLRWHHPTRGVLAPADFLAIAEETGLIEEIGAWVLDTAIKDCARLPDPMAVAVNLAPAQVRAPHLPATVADALARARLPANRLELEVDERVFTGDTMMPLDVLRRLRAQGVRIALDDFGTGRSTLGALNRAIFTRLKIDGSFVRDAGARPEALAIVRAIVALADCLGMTITAEGVETAADFQRMADLGCHRMQGYLLGRPLPFDRVLAQTTAALPALPLAANG